MQQVDPLIVLNTLIKHETLTINDLAKEENLGIPANAAELKSVLDNLAASGLVDELDNVSPPTYTITDKGISEGAKRNHNAEMQH